MSMSHDRVKFFLPSRNFNGRQGGFSKGTMKRVLWKAFGMSERTSDGLMCENFQGFWIICRPSQFARFIIYRAETGEGINGIKDLQPELFVPEPKRDAYDLLSEAAGLGSQGFRMAKSVAGALGLTEDDIRDKLCFDSRAAEPVVFDVSKNPFNQGFNNECNEETYAC